MKLRKFEKAIKGNLSKKKKLQKGNSDVGNKLVLIMLCIKKDVKGLVFLRMKTIFFAFIKF